MPQGDLQRGRLDPPIGRRFFRQCHQKVPQVARRLIGQLSRFDNLVQNNRPDQRQNFIQKDSPSNSTLAENVIKSPMVGTVYLSPSPEESTFVHVGKKIKKGDTILIIEAMKTMNQIPSSLEGTVKEILVSNESPVEFDTPLIIVE